MKRLINIAAAPEAIGPYAQSWNTEKMPEAFIT